MSRAETKFIVYCEWSDSLPKLETVELEVGPIQTRVRQGDRAFGFRRVFGNTDRRLALLADTPREAWSKFRAHAAENLARVHAEYRDEVQHLERQMAACDDVLGAKSS